MIRRRMNVLNFSMRLTTLLLPLVAFLIAGYIRFLSGLIPPAAGGIYPSDYVGLLLFATLVWTLVVEHYGLDRLDLVFATKHWIRNAFRASAVTYLMIMAATFFYRSPSFSRVFMALSAMFLFMLTVLTERGFRILVARARKKGTIHARILIVGTDEFAARAAQSLQQQVVMPSSIVGFIRLPHQEIAVAGTLIDLDPSAISLFSAEVDDVVIAIPPSRLGELPTIMAALEPLSVPVRVLLDIWKGIVVREAISNLGGLLMLDLRTAPTESVAYMLAKRGLDLVLSGLAILICAPLMFLITLAIRLTSSGPILFRQERVGLNGRTFRMYKFRTMEPSDSGESDVLWTKADDPRRTKVGALLRRTNLDELPQFFNVLKGEMSIVGPRPERPYFVDKFVHEIAQYNSRHYLKVGITGWAQVNGWRGDTSISRRIEHDLYYLQNWSLLFDLKIILLTLWRTIFANRNAY